jgi:hypothetical protein
MTVFTEGRHAAEFILSEANGQRSRENGTLVTGQNLVAGTVLMDNGAGKLTAFDASGGTGDDAVGILIYNVDATDADEAVSYLARDAEVNLKLITYPAESTEGGEEAETVSSLAAIGIIARD